MHEPVFGDDVVASIRASLLAFFDASARALPWRETRDPYAILVSEVMAQQTRVETVIPYYERWLVRFPDVHALADAPVDDVLKAWEGLGYYSRARNLHSAARVLRERHHGMLPASYDALRALPGVGDYTAGAVSSIAFGAREPAVDGNVRRVLARMLDDPAPTAARLRSTAAALVPHERPGDFNQSLMELGARICTPRAPHCDRCPVAAHCHARAAGTQLERPARTVKKALPVIDVATAVLRNERGEMLLVRRPARGLLAGMWTFPGVELNAGESAADAVMKMATSHAASTSPADELGVIEHTFSHRRERYLCWLVDVADAAPDGETMWIGADRSGVTLPRAQQRVHALACATAAPTRGTASDRPGSAV